MSEKIEIEVEDGEKVSAVYHPAKSDRWIFFCHGFGSNKKGSYEGRAKKAVEEGFNAVRFDFRGNGESDGDFIEKNLSSRIKDLEAVVEHFDPNKKAVFGSSFGGKVAFHSAVEIKFDFIVARAPVTYNESMEDYREQIKERGRIEKIEGKPVDARFFEDLDIYSFSDIEEEIESDIMIFHGDEDELVNIDNSLKAVSNLDNNVTLVKFREEGHSFSESSERVMREQMFQPIKNAL